MEGIYGYIYMRENLVTGQRYIGQHYYPKEGIDYSYKGSGLLLNEDIKKYGEENFSYNYIDVGYSKEDLNRKEMFWIKYYNTFENPIHYNLSEGGDGFSSEQVKQLWKNEEYRTKMSDVISLTMKEKWKDPSYRKSMVEKHNTEEYKQNLSENVKTQWLTRDQSKRLENLRKATSSEDWKEKHRKSAKKRYENDDYRLKMKQLMQKRGYDQQKEKYTIIKNYLYQNISFKDISLKTNIGYHTVINVIKRFNLEEYNRLKGITRNQNGFNNPSSKITPELAKSIIDDYKKGMIQKDIAKKYNLSKGCISSFISGRTYKNVER